MAGAGAYFWMLALAHAALGGFAAWRMSQRAALPLDEQGPVAPVTTVCSPVSVAIAPKAVRDQMDADLARAGRW